MESCSFLRDGLSTCHSKFNCREVEFRHPSYQDLNVRIYLCQNHFMEVFGQSIGIKNSTKPLEQEKWLALQVRGEDDRYRKKLAETRKQVRDGVGDTYFDWGTWKATNLRALDDLRSKLKILRRYQCRFEWCRQKITDFKQMYVIRIYPANQTDYVNLIFCCLNHWEVYKKRIGLVGLKGSLDETKAKPSITLDAYTPKKVTAEI